MRNLLRTTAIAAVGAAAFGLIATAGVNAAEKTLTIVSWGGAYSASQHKAYDIPFMKKHPDVKIVNNDKAANGLAGIRAQEESGNVTWDVVDMLQAPALTGCDEGILEPIDHDKLLAPAPDGTPASKDFIKGTMGDCFVPEILYATLFNYNNTMFPKDKAPKTVKDVWNVKEFPGKRGLQKIPAGNLEWALVADGVPYDKVYEVLKTDKGVARAFNKLSELKPDTVWWTEGAQPPQLLADKEVSIATAYNGRIFNAQVVEHQPFTTIWDGQLFEVDGWVVPKGKLSPLVKEYLRFATDTQRLADQAKYISYGPARQSSAPLVGKHAETGVDMKPYMPTNPENLKTAIAKNVEFWADNGDTLSERFNAWLAK